MRHFRSILLAACVALLDAPWGCEGAMIPPYNNSAHAADCTDAFNAARAAAGLAPLKKSSRPMLDQSLQELYTHCRLACAGLQPGFMPADQLGIQGTLIFSPQQGPEGDCDAAVSYLKKGHRWFGSVPPVFHRFGEAPYDKFQTVGFVGLYNPKEDADIDCAYFTCYGFEGLEEVPKSVHRGFMCITNPLALQEGEAPFSKEQFQQIRKSIYDAEGAQGQAVDRATMSLFGKRKRVVEDSAVTGGQPMAAAVCPHSVTSRRQGKNAGRLRGVLE